MNELQVLVKRLEHGRNIVLPIYMTPLASGLDLMAAIDTPMVIGTGCITIIPTGLALAIPNGYEGQIRARSGLAANYGLTVINSPGTIDADYRGEVKVILINLGSNQVTIFRGDRIAQLIISPVMHAKLVEVTRLPTTQRGEGGIGHTDS